MVSYLYTVQLLLLVNHFNTVYSGCTGSVSVLPAAFDSVGTLTTTNYPGAYPSNSDCRWKIRAADSSQKVVLYFEDFQTEPTYDYLYIYDGDSEYAAQLFSGSGTYSGVWWTSSSEYLYLWFTSDYSVELKGFSIKYISSNGSASTNIDICPDPITAVTGSQVQIGMIGSEISCQYLITAENSGHVRFSLLIDDHSGVQVFDGISFADSKIVEYTPSFADTNIYQSTGNSALIVKPPRGKFIMFYERVDVSETAPPPVVSPPTTVSSENSCSGGQLVATSSYGLILSPYYPDFYPHNLDCSVTVTASDPSRSVLLTVIDMAVLYCCDYVEIFDGPDASYTSYGTFWPVGTNWTSTGPSLHVVFHSDSSGSLRGFQFQYLESSRALPSCTPISYSGIDANSSVQSINSPNYPSNYDDDVLEYWLVVKPSESDSIVLEIRDIELEHSSDCDYDNITIYDGACTDSPVLAVICGSDKRTIEDASGLYILVRFATDSSVTYKGFEMAVYIGEPEEDNKLDPRLLYLIPIVIIAVIVLIVVGCICYRCQKRQKRAKHVTPVTTSLTPVSKPPPLTRMTTQQLLHELQTRYGSRELDKKPKKKRKSQYYQPEPGSSGITNYGYTPSQPHPMFGSPPPPYSGTTTDPTYPPNFFEVSANEAKLAPTPALAPESHLPPSPETPAFTVIPEPTAIPPATSYLTPAEARQAGLYGQF